MRNILIIWVARAGKTTLSGKEEFLELQYISDLIK